MKTQTLTSFLTTFLLVVSLNAHSQNWLLAGNGSTSPTTDYLGTSDNTDLVFRTNATERLRIGSGGNLSIAGTGGLGIGTTTPNFLLQTHEGTASTANYIQVGNNTSGITSADGLLIGLDASANAVLNQQENLPMIFRTNAIEKMRIEAGGNVGIGQNAPTYLLDLGTGDLNLEDGIIRIGDDEMVYYNTTQNNLGFGTVHDFNAITSGGDNIFVGFNA